MGRAYGPKGLLFVWSLGIWIGKGEIFGYILV